MDTQVLQVPVSLPLWLYVGLLLIVGALAWIRRGVSRIEAALSVDESGFHCPDCAEPVKAEARICKYCRCDLTDYFRQCSERQARIDAEILSTAQALEEAMRVSALERADAQKRKSEARLQSIEKLIGKRVLSIFKNYWKKAIAVVGIFALLVVSGVMYLRQNVAQAASFCAILNGEAMPTQAGYVAEAVAIPGDDVAECTVFLLSGYANVPLQNIGLIPNFPYSMQRSNLFHGQRVILITPKSATP